MGRHLGMGFQYTCMHIVVVVPDTGGTRCMVECPQCLGLQLFCSLLPSGSVAPPPDTTTPLLARYLLIKIWLPGNGLQMCNVHHIYTCAYDVLCECGMSVRGMIVQRTYTCSYMYWYICIAKTWSHDPCIPAPSIPIGNDG